MQWSEKINLPHYYCPVEVYPQVVRQLPLQDPQPPTGSLWHTRSCSSPWTGHLPPGFLLGISLVCSLQGAFRPHFPCLCPQVNPVKDTKQAISIGYSELQIFFKIGWLVGFVALRPKSTAMVIAGRSVHLTTLFPGQA